MNKRNLIMKQLFCMLYLILFKEDWSLIVLFSCVKSFSYYSLESGGASATIHRAQTQALLAIFLDMFCESAILRTIFIVEKEL
jgi:hypothetical protein